MKNIIKITTGIYFLITLISVTHAQTNFIDSVASLWFSGDKEKVLKIAEQRINSNSNDLVGLIIKMDYEVSFVQLEALINTMNEIVQIGSSVTTKYFSTEFPTLEAGIEHLKMIIPMYPPEELEADRQKGNIPGKPLPHLKALKALEKDGYLEK